MLAQRQAVEHGDPRLGGELDGDLMRARADHDPVDEPFEVAGDVADALASAEHDVVRQVDRMPAELDHPGLERDPRPQAGLLEQHGQRPTGQRRIDMSPGGDELGLEFGRGAEDAPDLVGRQVGDGKQVTADKRARSRADGHAVTLTARAAAGRDPRRHGP